MRRSRMSFPSAQHGRSARSREVSDSPLRSSGRIDRRGSMRAKVSRRCRLTGLGVPRPSSVMGPRTRSTAWLSWESSAWRSRRTAADRFVHAWTAADRFGRRVASSRPEAAALHPSSGARVDLGRGHGPGSRREPAREHRPLGPAPPRRRARRVDQAGHGEGVAGRGGHGAGRAGRCSRGRRRLPGGSGDPYDRAVLGSSPRMTAGVQGPPRSG